MRLESVLAMLRLTRVLGRRLIEQQPAVSFTYKPDGSVLSELDREIQTEILQAVRSLEEPELRRARFVGEEERASGETVWELRRSELNWVVDAIDGTAAYTLGLNIFSISIALLDGDFEPLLGLIHVPAMFGRTYLASAHSGRLQNYVVSWSGDEPELTAAPPISAPTGWRNGPGLVERSYLYAASNVHRLPLSRFPGKVRNLGATATHLALLTAGSEDPVAVVLSRCKAWDVAGGLALAEAGGLEIRWLEDWRLLSYSAVFLESNGLRLPLPAIVGHPQTLAAIRTAFFA